MPQVTVAEAAQQLGLRPEAIRRRLRRGVLRGRRTTTPDGVRWLVDLPESDLPPAGAPPPPDGALTPLLRTLHDTAGLLREEIRLRRHDADANERAWQELRRMVAGTLADLRDLLASPPLPKEPSSAPKPTAHATPAPGPPPPGAATSQTRSRFVTLALRQHYLEWGDPTLPPLLLLHGLTGNAHNFEALAQQLAGAFHLFALDLRGHGESHCAPNQDYRLSAHVHDLDRFLTAFALENVALIGTALGAAVALAYAGARPYTVRRLVINDSGPETNRSGEERVRSYLRESPAAFPTLKTAVTWWRDTYPILRGYDLGTLRAFVLTNLKEQEDGSFIWRFDPLFRTLAGHPQLHDVDLWASARLVRCPTLIVRGAESDILSPAVAHRLRDTIPGAQLVDLPQVGHAPSLLEPEILPLLRRFLQ